MLQKCLTVMRHASPPLALQVTLHFCPDFARTFLSTIHLFLEGQEKRLTVNAQGVGLGPSALLSYDTLDIGNAYIHTLHRYQMILENRGAIPVPFEIMPGRGLLAHAFDFDPPDGAVDVNSKLTLNVNMLADRLGRFDQRFNLQIAGTNQPVEVQFKGKIVGPTCNVSIDRLDFGLVAFGFRYAYIPVRRLKQYESR
jgi:hydrocephalus-inducing protein